MRASSLGEFGLIDNIRAQLNAKKSKGVILGIGDDAAAVRASKRKFTLLTTDTLVENVHFSFKYASFYDIGWKLAAVSLSDIAAMGGEPKYALVTLGLRSSFNVSDIKELYRGIKTLASKYNVVVVGGDIVLSPKSAFFTMDMFGVSDRLVTRSGARPGDNIYYTGPLGYSGIGLEILKRKKTVKGGGKFINAHLRPAPLVRQGRMLAGVATSMIDNSDGLARCLIEITGSSRVGAEISAQTILGKDIVKMSAKLKKDPMRFILDGGEDYGLLFTARARKVPVNAVRIGSVTASRKIFLIDEKGVRRELKDKGFRHF